MDRGEAVFSCTRPLLLVQRTTMPHNYCSSKTSRSLDIGNGCIRTARLGPQTKNYSCFARGLAIERFVVPRTTTNHLHNGSYKDTSYFPFVSVFSIPTVAISILTPDSNGYQIRLEHMVFIEQEVR